MKWLRLRPEHEDVAGVEDAQREHRAVALVGLEQQAQRVDDHAVRAADARRVVAGRVAAARPALGLQLERDAPQRVGADRLRSGQRHTLSTYTRACRATPSDRCLRARARGPGPRALRGVLRRPARAAGGRALGAARGDLGDGRRPHADRAVAAADRARGRPAAASTCTSRCTSPRPTTTRRVERLRAAGEPMPEHAFGTDARARRVPATDPDGHVVELWTWDVSGHLATMHGMTARLPDARPLRGLGSVLGIVISVVALAAVVWWALRQEPPQLPAHRRRGRGADRGDRALRRQHAGALGALAPAAARRRRAPAARRLLLADHRSATPSTTCCRRAPATPRASC